MENLAFFEWGPAEYRRALTGMIAPTDSRSLPGMRDEFGTLLVNRTIYPLNMARVGLTMALKIFRSQRPDARDVIVPAYICPSVIEAVRSAGLHPVPADIGPDLNLDLDALEASISPHTLAAIAVHMYGCPATIREMETICRRHGVFLIDDSAQVAGVSVDGQPLGTFGDAGVISFSQSKTIVTGCQNAGGLLIVNNKELEAQMAAAYEALPLGRASFRDIATFFWNYSLAPWTETPTYYFGRVTGMVPATETEQTQTAARMNSVVAALALEQLKSLQVRIDGRRRIADLFHRKVSMQRAVEFPQFAPGRYLTRIMLSLPDGTNLAEIRDRLRRRGMRTRRGYPVYGSELARPPERALNLQPRLIELPSHSRMTAETVDKIWRIFETALNTAKV